LIEALISHTSGSEGSPNQPTRNANSDLLQQQYTAPNDLDRKLSSREDLVGEIGQATLPTNIDHQYYSEQIKNLNVP